MLNTRLEQMFEPYLTSKMAKKAAKVIQMIENLKSQEITAEDMIETLAQQFNVMRLTRAFIACMFCMPDFVEKYILFVYTHFGTGSISRPSPFAKDAAVMLRLFACFDFNFSIKAHKEGMAPTMFSLFAYPKDVDPLWTPIMKPVHDFYLCGNALVLFQAINSIQEQSMFEECKDCEEYVVIRSTDAFVEMANSLVDRTKWVVSFLRTVAFSPLQSTSTTDQHIYAVRTIQHMLSELPLEKVQLDKTWISEGKNLVEAIGQSDLEPHEVVVAYDYIRAFLAQKS